MIDMLPTRFESLVRETLENLPQQFQVCLENVAVVVEEEPDPEEVDELGVEPDDELFGLYRGVSLMERGAAHTGLPDSIVIYRGPILRYADSFEEAAREIRETVIHELGHHMGLDDEEMVF